MSLVGELMKLDFNETNILVQTLASLEQDKMALGKSELIRLLCVLYDNTSDERRFVRGSIKSLLSKIENLSDENIKKIQDDKAQGKIIATTCYRLPNN